MKIILNNKLKLYFLLIISFSVVNFIISRCDPECNKELFQITTPLDAIFFTTIVQTTNFFRYTGSQTKLSPYLKISIIIHIVLFLIITKLE